MKDNRIVKRGLLIVLLLMPTGCVQLPEYARPRFQDQAYAATIDPKGFRYRMLTVDDFQADSLPPDYNQYNHHINAHSCISIRPAETSKAKISRGEYQGQVFFMGTIPEVTFEALFVPACSWWNPDVTAEQTAYVLEHEQIHFGLAELAARQLNRNARDELKDFLAINDTYREVEEELRNKLRNIAHAAMEDSFEIHTEFDKETSLFHDPRAQKWWRRDVEERLAAETP